MLPKSLMSEIKQGSVEIAGEDIDLSDLQSAYEKDLNQKTNTTDETTDAMPDMNQQDLTAQMPGQGAQNAPSAF